MDHPCTFAELGLSPRTLETLEAKGFEEPSPIQCLVVPRLLQGERDLVGQAQTGTGKTAAFGLPLVERLEPAAGHVQALILTPTRELCVQVGRELASLDGSRRLRITPLYGGQPYGGQLASLRRGVDIVVGTPGRVLDHLTRGTLDLGSLSYAILDEADEMLSMGFIEDVEAILEHSPDQKRTLLFSATMPPRIKAVAKRFMGDYEVVADASAEPTVALTNQIYYEVLEEDKLEVLCRSIDISDGFYGIVFCRTRLDVDEVGRHLQDRGYAADSLHGERNQSAREAILGKFRRRHTSILVATDVAARGIDVEELTHVINYDLPQDPDTYIHRIGRTGRAGRQGTAITFVTPRERGKIGVIERIAKTRIERTPVPRIDEVVARKQARVRDDVAAIVAKGEPAAYLAMAAELLVDRDPTAVVAALLEHGFRTELDVSTYREIKEIKPYKGPSAKEGRTRLYVGMGSADGLTPRKLLGKLQELAGVESKRVVDIFIMESYSFVTVTSGVAKGILEVFAKRARGGRPLVTLATERRSGKKQFLPGSQGYHKGKHKKHEAGGPKKPWKRSKKK